jgi:outer membrane protein OmpA-like peptidoglycan-associated protein
LPNEDHTVGRANVSDRAGAVDLTNAWESTRVGAGHAPSPVVAMSEAQVTAMFHDLIAALPPAPQHFTLYFQFASDELTPESRALMTEIVAAVRSRPSPDVIVVGHTDSTGTSARNYELGLQRATIVRTLLIASGLDAASVSVTSHGEGDPLVRTADDAYEPRNRRVEIDIQ